MTVSDATATALATAAAAAVQGPAVQLSTFASAADALKNLQLTVGRDVTAHDLIVVGNLMLGQVDESKWGDISNLLLHKRALALSGGGCISVVSQFGFLEMLRTITPDEQKNSSFPAGIQLTSAS